MKRFIALLLILSLAIGLVACAKPATDPTDTENITTGESTTNTNTNTVETSDPTETTENSVDNTGDKEPNSNDKYINPEAFAGKTLQIWGYAQDYYADPEDPDYYFNSIIRAAVDEWAVLNQVEVEFVANYNETEILGAFDSGEKPDLLLSCNYFPAIAAMEIARPFTEEEYATLSGIIPASYIDTITYKGQSYGFQAPWAGNDVFVYNRTMFETYNAKTPKEYYMEDNWTWDTMVECWKAITKDLDGDGKMDTYGVGCYSSIFENFPIAEDATGKLSSMVLSDKYKKQREILYEGSQEGFVGTYAFCTLSKDPRPGTMDGTAALYDYNSIIYDITNGDIMEVVPMPAYDKNDPHNAYHLNITSIFSTCDEPEAAFALLCYLSKVTMRWMADYSLGLYSCDFEGLRGASELSKAVMEYGEEVMEDRRLEFEELEDWDQEYYEKLVNDINSRRITYYRFHTNYGPTYPTSLDKEDPEDVLDQIDGFFEDYCEEFNETFIE